MAFARSVMFKEGIFPDDLLADKVPLQTLEQSIEGGVVLSNRALRRPVEHEVLQLRVILQIN